MSEQNTPSHPFFQPRSEHDDLQTAHLLWKIAGNIKVTPSGCWEWAGFRTKAGYGSIYASHPHGGSIVYAHRLVYSLCVSDIPEGMQILHNCDNPPCCNLAHLFLGTQLDNVIDMDRKGRRIVKALYGEEASSAKLTWVMVEDVRRRVANGEPTTHAMADELGINYSTLRRIVTGKTWNREKRGAS